MKGEGDMCVSSYFTNLSERVEAIVRFKELKVYGFSEEELDIFIEQARRLSISSSLSFGDVLMIQSYYIKTENLSSTILKLTELHAIELLPIDFINAFNGLTLRTLKSESKIITFKRKVCNFINNICKKFKTMKNKF